jgi:hypothetical protein
MKFKKDFGVEDSVADQQSAHQPNTAGRLYARGIEEAPGVVESKRRAFRAISRKWHKFLGFQVQTGLIKRSLGEISGNSRSKRQKAEETPWEF